MKKIMAIIFLIPFISFSNPSQGIVVSGSAQISQSGSTVNVRQTSDKAIVNWDGFSINSGEQTIFVQPNKNASILNRVTGTNISNINGLLEGNGKIFLVNPNGIIIGSNGIIRADTFLASTLEIKNDNFLKNRKLSFSSEGNATIINDGIIEAGTNVYLIARQIDNRGLLDAQEGAYLGVGEEILLSEENSSFAVQAGEGQIINSGTIKGIQTEVKASFGNIYSLAINQEGLIDATYAVEEKGRILLLADTGKIAVSGNIKTAEEKAGEIKLLADEVLIEATAVIDASCQSGEGKILIGGDYKGQGPDVKNANKVEVESGSIIKADSLQSGKGGRVILWSNNETSFYGNISAQALAQGDGGFVEVSSKRNLNFQGIVNTSSLNGKKGKFLLDPANITISGDSSDPVVVPPISEFNPDQASSVLNVINLKDSLAFNDVEISTSNEELGDGNIIVATDISWAENTTLTLLADRAISINANIANTYDGESNFTALVMRANEAGTTVGDFSGITLADRKTITSEKGNVNLLGKGGTFSNNTGIYLNENTKIESTGTDANAATITLNGYGIGAVDKYKSHGVYLRGGQIKSQAGAIVINATGGDASLGNNCGMCIVNMGQVVSIGTATIDITAIAGTEKNYNEGLYIYGKNSYISSVDGAININATGGSGFSSNFGLALVQGGQIISTGLASINITSIGGAGLHYNYGAFIYGTESKVSSTDATITINVDGGASTGSFNCGLVLINGGKIDSTESANINVTSTGGTGENYNFGLYMDSICSMISSVDGNIDILTTGGDATGSNNEGLYTNEGEIISTGTGEVSVIAREAP